MGPRGYRTVMTLSMDDFIAELSQMIVHWKKDAARLNGSNPLADEVAAWLAEADRIIAAHERHSA